jgi:hypothetical protein
VLPCIAVVVALCWAIYVYREELAPLGKGDTLVEDGILRRLDIWSKARTPLTPVVTFGDSLGMCTTPPSGAIENVWAWMGRSLTQSGVPSKVYALGQPGLRPLHFFAVLDDVLAKPVRLVVIEINLRAFTDPKAVPGAERLPQLARKLDLRSALRVLPALELDGLSLFDPFISQLKEQLGLLYVFEGLRQLVLDRLADLGQAANATLGLRTQSFRLFFPYADRTRQTYLIDYADHPETSALRATVEDLRAANVPFFLYVAPIDVDRYAATGQYERAAMEQRLDELRRALGVSEAEWLDLHDAIHDSSLFRDANNHLKLTACPLVGRMLAQRAHHRLAHAAEERAARMRRTATDR